VHDQNISCLSGKENIVKVVISFTKYTSAINSLLLRIEVGSCPVRVSIVNIATLVGIHQKYKQETLKHSTISDYTQPVSILVHWPRQLAASLVLKVGLSERY
jgi:hypothetical protein